ncbi:MAG: pseudouridine synthase [Pseudomonadota bacterium]|nr:pseudouridine synthase [Pseudomonadota bacterium]
MKRVTAGRRIGLARVLSKRGLCSRTAAERMIRAGEVRVRGRVVRDPESATNENETAITLAGAPAAAVERRCLMLNKPRGLLTTHRDEQGRDTVYRCFDGHQLGWIAPVGRLDKASEGLLLFSNDPAWAARITDPLTGPVKTYHVQVAGLPAEADMRRMEAGVVIDGERLAAQRARLLRHGEKNAWLEIVLDEGRNRQIRRILGALDFDVLRLLRVAIGPLQLGDLGKGEWRELSAVEAERLIAG